ncbi:uncharacterized protein KD926_004644 [Aspergillus affinis]|uniref:uncharacterized protein n=1 Tax=Aspergillus affinis TaxID=1070780 RepID=UPI0022FE2F5F|nr:uncharacterized protein KD926_004644 [Aspergillus affinis]KAI9035079.1 hypothetical protein KD926_004644 [Aspergillus affinis]
MHRAQRSPVVSGHDKKKPHSKPPSKPHSKPNPPGKPEGPPPPNSALGPKKPIGHCKPKGKGSKGGKGGKGDKGQHIPRSLDDDATEDDYAGKENNLYARDDADGLSCNDGVPSIARIKEELKNKTVKDSCLFYSGPQGYSYSSKATQWRNKPENRQYRLLNMNWKIPEWTDQWKDDEDIKVLDKRASQAMAELCAGEVVVILPSNTKGTVWHKGTVWDKYEWPNLSSAVTKVTRINPDNDNKEVIKGH